MSPLPKFLNFFTHMPGIQVLRLILLVEMIMFVGGTVHKILFTIKYYYILYAHNISYYADVIWVTFLIYKTLYELIPLFLLWRGVVQRSKKLLRIYVIVKAVFLPPMAVLFILLIIHGPFSKLPGNFISDSIRNISLSILLLITLYNIFVVHEYYKRLECPVMAQLHDHYTYLKEIQTSKYEMVKPSEEICTDSNEFSKFVSYKIFNEYLLSPLDVTIDHGCILGEGMFGRVYKGVMLINKTKIKIAAKVAKEAQSSEGMELVLQEIKTMIHAGHHENVVKFYGVTSDASLKHRVVIITEFCSLGCLEDFLIERRDCFTQNKMETYINLDYSNTHVITISHLTGFATDILKGMEHLVSHRIVHGDLACRNILLTTDLKAKITDFGMSRRLYAYQIYSKTPSQTCFLPWRWMSLEAIEDLSFSEKSDVWSYGVTLWEIFSLGEFPFDNVEWSEHVPKRIREGLMKLEKPVHANDEMYKIMNECWTIDKCDRPAFLDLRIKLKAISEQQIPMSLHTLCDINNKSVV